MARTLTRASRVYNPGTYGPFAIDSFTKGSASHIEVAMTVEGWPDGADVATLVLTTSSGARMTVNVPAKPIDLATGKPATVFRCRLGFPADGVVVDGVPQPPVTRETTGASVSATVHRAITTALIVRAA